MSMMKENELENPELLQTRATWSFSLDQTYLKIECVKEVYICILGPPTILSLYPVMLLHLQRYDKPLSPLLLHIDV